MSEEPLAWGVLPGDGLPLWRCSSRQQANRMVEWLREQRHESSPEAVRLVDGRSPALTAAEREAVRFCVTAALPETQKLGGVAGELCRMHAATLRGLLARLSPPAT